MAEVKMPLLLDDAMPVDLNNVDDLFGDDVHLQLPLRSLGKQLSQRLDDLKNRGCCQAVAWSKAGTIASLTQDRQGLELRYLRSHPETGDWAMSETTTCDLVKGSPTIPLVHLEWSTTNSPELAVIDAVGRVVILNFAVTVNQPTVSRKWEADAVDEVHAVVGCFWLSPAPANPSKTFNVMYGPANKQGNGYSYENSFVQALGPCHPNPNKSALFCITANGLLKMFWSQNHGRVEETSMELDSVNTSDEVLTHAAFSSDKRNLLVAIATSSRQLRLLKIEIQWGGPGSSSEKPLPPNARLNPALVESHVASTNWLGPGALDGNIDMSLSELSYLQVLPPVMHSTNSGNAAPLLLTLRSRALGEGGFSAPQTVMDRWEVAESKSSLDPAFEQLGNRGNSNSSEPATALKLRKLAPSIVGKVVIGLQSINYGKALVLFMSDGSIEHRDRFTFEECFTDQDAGKIWTLRQAGWLFPEDVPCLQAAYSPTRCSVVQVGDDGKLKWTKLQYPLGDIGNSAQDAPYSATVAGLTITAASVMSRQGNLDDLLALVHPFASKKRFVLDWVSELIRILKTQVDFSEETHHDTLMKNSPLHTCLSIMNSLGFKGEFRRRTFQSKLAMLDLNMRNVVILITLASNVPMNLRDKFSPLDEHEAVDALTGCVKWLIDLLSWVTDCLFELMHDPEFQKRTVPQRFSELNAYLVERNDVSVHLLFSSSSRSFLSAVCRRVALLDTMCSQATNFYKSQALGDTSSGARAINPQLQQVYYKMQKVTSSSLIKVTEFEKLLNVLAHDVRSAYLTFLPQLVKSQPNAPQGKQQLENMVKTTQTQFEIAMLLASSPPPAFMPVIRKFFSKDLPAFRKMTNPASLFYADFELLGVEDDDFSLATRRKNGIYVDHFRRLRLRRGADGLRWRRCARCASVMEDVSSNRPGFAFLLNQQRRCPCGGPWAIIPKE